MWHQSHSAPFSELGKPSRSWAVLYESKYVLLLQAPSLLSIFLIRLWKRFLGVRVDKIPAVSQRTTEALMKMRDGGGRRSPSALAANQNPRDVTLLQSRDFSHFEEFSTVRQFPGICQSCRSVRLTGSFFVWSPHFGILCLFVCLLVVKWMGMYNFLNGEYCYQPELGWTTLQSGLLKEDIFALLKPLFLTFLSARFLSDLWASCRAKGKPCECERTEWSRLVGAERPRSVGKKGLMLTELKEHSVKSNLLMKEALELKYWFWRNKLDGRWGNDTKKNVYWECCIVSVWYHFCILDILLLFQNWIIYYCITSVCSRPGQRKMNKYEFEIFFPPAALRPFGF